MIGVVMTVMSQTLPLRLDLTSEGGPEGKPVNGTHLCGRIYTHAG